MHFFKKYFRFIFSIPKHVLWGLGIFISYVIFAIIYMTIIGIIKYIIVFLMFIGLIASVFYLIYLMVRGVMSYLKQKKNIH